MAEPAFQDEEVAVALEPVADRRRPRNASGRGHRAYATDPPEAERVGRLDHAARRLLERGAPPRPAAGGPVPPPAGARASPRTRHRRARHRRSCPGKAPSPIPPRAPGSTGPRRAGSTRESEGTSYSGGRASQSCPPHRPGRDRGSRARGPSRQLDNRPPGRSRCPHPSGG